MKIFDWMHRKLNLSSEYHRVAHRNAPDAVISEETSEKSSRVSAGGTVGIEQDSRALLLPHVLLAIGTLGHSHPSPLLLPLPLEKLLEAEAEQHESEDDHQSEPIDQSSTAIAAVVFHPDAIDELPKPLPAVEDHKKSSKPQETAAEEEIVIKEPLLKEDKQNAELAQKRITLADLFAAEPAILEAAAAAAAAVEEKSEEECGLKTQLKVATSADKKQVDAGRSKKMKKKVEESLVPRAKKLHRLITRMLKKKIHPDGATRGGGEEPPRHGRKGAVVDCLHGGWSGAAVSANLVNCC